MLLKNSEILKHFKPKKKNTNLELQKNLFSEFHIFGIYIFFNSSIIYEFMKYFFYKFRKFSIQEICFLF